VIPAISIAANGLAVQSQRIEAVARDIASMGATTPGSGTPAAGSSVRIGSLPVGDPTDSMVTLVEAENAYRMNAAVIRAASDMLDTLLEAVTPRRQR
jgi:flagellar basal body rod protein FlgC